MNAAYLNDQFVDFALRFLLNAIAITCLTIGMFQRHLFDRELALTAVVFNIFTFALLAIPLSVGIYATAVLFIVTATTVYILLYDQFSKTEIGYLLASITFGMTFNLFATSFLMIIVVVTIGLLIVRRHDRPLAVPVTANPKLTLDRAEAHILLDPEFLRSDLSNRLGINATKIESLKVDFDDDAACITVFYHPKEGTPTG